MIDSFGAPWGGSVHAPLVLLEGEEMNPEYAVRIFCINATSTTAIRFSNNSRISDYQQNQCAKGVSALTEE